jgi:TRAP-type C4-dicarboxylate transport system substrate-binding protein
VAVAAAAGLLTVAACGGATDKAGGAKPATVVALRIVNTRDAQELQPFTDKVAELSGGTLKVTGTGQWGSGSTTAEADAIKAVRAGTYDLALVPVRAWHDAGATSFDALIAPLAVDSMAAQQKVLTSDLPAQMLAGVMPLGLTGISILPGPMRKPDGVTRTFTSPADFKGARIGYSPSAVGDRALRALGATPVASAFDGSDISSYDAIEQQVDSVAGNVYDGVVKTITANVNLWPRALVIVGNTKALGRLTPQQAAWLKSAGTAAVGTAVQADLKREAAAMTMLCGRAKVKFGTAAPAQVAQLRAAVQPVYDWLRQDQQTSRFLARVDALKAGVQPEAAPSCPAAGQPAAPVAGQATPFDGTYQMDVSEKVWRTTDSELHPENWGAFKYVFGGGRFASTQENAQACTWAYGTYKVDGTQVTLSFLDGGGIAPTNAQNKPGEEFVQRWSLYHGTLTLTAISPADLPPMTWHQLGVKPDGSVLSRRCLPPAAAMAW